MVGRRCDSGDNHQACWGADAGCASGAVAEHDATSSGSAVPSTPGRWPAESAPRSRVGCVAWASPSHRVPATRLPDGTYLVLTIITFAWESVLHPRSYLSTLFCTQQVVHNTMHTASHGFVLHPVLAWTPPGESCLTAQQRPTYNMVYVTRPKREKNREHGGPGRGMPSGLEKESDHGANGASRRTI